MTAPHYRLVAVALAVSGCCGSVPPPHVAHLSGIELIVIGNDDARLGVARTPSGADPIQVDNALPLLLDGCHTRDEIDATYGERCEGFESTARGGGSAAGGAVGASPSTPGLHPPSRSEAWYCRPKWVLRASMVACTPASADHPATFRVAQIALAPAERAIR